MSLLTLGTVAFDTIETPFGKADRIIGGAGTYIAWAASHFHKDLQLLSVIGEDFPAEELAALEARGVNLDGLEKREGEKSFFWAGRYHMNMNARDTLATELNVLENYSPKLPEGYKNPEYLLLGNFAPAVQMQVLEQLEKRPKLVAMDTMNFWMDIAMEELKAVLKQVDILIINDEEARQLSGEYSLVKAARVIREMGPKYLVIKKGEHGALLFHGESTFFVPALPLEEVFDPTGAGDSFAGGFMGYLAQEDDHSLESMKRALVYGSVVASFCVEAFGPNRLKEIDEAALDARKKAFQNLMEVKL
ncbi:PfkB family carbohydrate kinase [Saprospira grandis]|uniref:PfkB domain protein n=1 Tax=Saprospira grandis (strain Lewin) TaxID=984262 RepID=H6L6D3_SAPGL|nr:PfkB family carbohydrate kinase [Saprospira grandis]AFC24075.1 PfkB domain protein [Saprospira grandis str. Lewin]WBM75625.1 PfkB family carbohydrate kinase [Saprospira grandis]